jgi:hypothetical protein
VVVQCFVSPAHEEGRAADGDEWCGGAPEGGGTASQREEGNDLGWADLGQSAANSSAEHLEHGPASRNSKEN